MADKTAEKAHVTKSLKHIPKDAQVIMSIMKDMEITEYEPRVINQLLEFTYRYVACIIDDARLFAKHAKKKEIDLEDVKLAIDMVLEKSFASPPSRASLLELARKKNSNPFPAVKPSDGIRLPPDRYCLTSCNYIVKPFGTKTQGAKGSNKSVMNISSVFKRTGSVTNASRTQTVTVPKPIIKFSTSVPAQQNQQKQSNTLKPQVITTISSSAVDLKTQNTGSMNMQIDTTGSSSQKRKREDEDEDYDIA